MVHKKVTIIPAANAEGRDPHMGTPGKTHVVGYGRVVKRLCIKTRIWEILLPVSNGEAG